VHEVDFISDGAVPPPPRHVLGPRFRETATYWAGRLYVRRYSLPGPSLPVYLAGCRLRAIHPAVPFAAGHTVSMGMCTVGGDACFGCYADRTVLPDAAGLAGDIDTAFDELLSAG